MIVLVKVLVVTAFCAGVELRKWLFPVWLCLRVPRFASDQSLTAVVTPPFVRFWSSARPSAE